MSKKKPQNFFTKNGKELKQFLRSNIALFNDNIRYSEAISSLTIAEQPKRSPLLNIKKRIHNFNSYIKSTGALDKRILAKVWISGSFATFALFATLMIFYPMKVIPATNNKYSIYASTPLLLSSHDYTIYSKDARAQKINQVFKSYKCPLEGLGEVFVYEADKHNIPWWLVAAISFQESSCGKMTPEPGGIESYNAWGWAVYGDNVQAFDNWVRGIETVSEYLQERFFSKGITEPCDIMKVYTPPSKGSWCAGVNNYGEEIRGYHTPESTETR